MNNSGPPLRGGPGQEIENGLIGRRSKYPAIAAAAIPNVVDFERAAEEAAKAVPDFSEDETALAFADRHHKFLRFDHSTGDWYVYSNRWQRDPKQLALNYARTFGRLLAEDRRVPNRVRLRSLKFAQSVDRLARSDPRMAVISDIWDADLDLLGTPNTVINLETGEEVEPHPDFCITRSVTVDPDIAATGCTNWLRFLDDITGQDEAFIRFLQQWTAYCLSGRTDLQKLLFITGPGGTGKSTFITMLLKMLAGYATSADMTTFTDAGFEQHPQQFARLAGMRLVTASETEEGRHWRESRIKQLTGGDLVTAHFMRENDFTYRPQFKLTFIGNSTPLLRNVDSAIQRRMIIVPFMHQPVEPDPRLEEKLTKEMPGILRWALNGYADLCTHGLLIPKAIGAATSTHFSDQDVFSAWIAECCDFEPGNWALSESNANLFRSWSGFARSQGTEPGNSRTFNDRLRRIGLEPGQQIKHLGTKGCRGIRLKLSPHWQDR
jgi:putative DNA primase/helicase